MRRLIANKKRLLKREVLKRFSDVKRSPFFGCCKGIKLGITRWRKEAAA
jgi:hypothetical protein